MCNLGKLQILQNTSNLAQSGSLAAHGNVPSFSRGGLDHYGMGFGQGLGDYGYAVGSPGLPPTSLTSSFYSSLMPPTAPLLQRRPHVPLPAAIGAPPTPVFTVPPTRPTTVNTYSGPVASSPEFNMQTSGRGLDLSLHYPRN